VVPQLGDEHPADLSERDRVLQGARHERTIAKFRRGALRRLPARALALTRLRRERRGGPPFRYNDCRPHFPRGRAARRPPSLRPCRSTPSTPTSRRRFSPRRCRTSAASTIGRSW
jgi:hypothetical protein